jgi:hypothetical protein
MRNIPMAIPTIPAHIVSRNICNGICVAADAIGLNDHFRVRVDPDGVGSEPGAEVVHIMRPGRKFHIII